MNYGQPLVLDCGYEHLMQGRETESYVRQVYKCIQDNMFFENPFNLTLCEYLVMLGT